MNPAGKPQPPLASPVVLWRLLAPSGISGVIWLRLSYPLAGPGLFYPPCLSWSVAGCIVVCTADGVLNNYDEVCVESQRGARA